MIKVPFTPESFAAEFKVRISGVHLNYEYENIASTLAKVARDMASLLGQAVYDRLVAWYESDSDPAPSQKNAVDYLQRVMLHFAFYEHLIFLQLNIKNDGITTKKSDEETTAFKYQTDELKNKLINSAWFWFNELIALMNDNSDDFAEWTSSEQRMDTDALGITYADFNKWFSVDSWYFFIKARYIIQEVMSDEIQPRWPEKDMNKKELADAMHRALAYRVMALATFRFAYNELPESIRLDIDNEQSKTSKTEEFKHVKEHVSKSLDYKASQYLQKFEAAVAAARTQSEVPTAATAVYVRPQRVNERDKFYFAG